MYNKTVSETFSYSTADSQRYGNSSFGNACLVAKKVLAADQGTRFILITNGSWDMHQDIYGAQNATGNNLYTMGKALDDGYSALGIDWTTIRKDDPFGRGFEYVPFSDQDLYGPINELWG